MTKFNYEKTNRENTLHKHLVKEKQKAENERIHKIMSRAELLEEQGYQECPSCLRNTRHPAYPTCYFCWQEDTQT